MQTKFLALIAIALTSVMAAPNSEPSFEVEAARSGVCRFDGNCPAQNGMCHYDDGTSKCCGAGLGLRCKSENHRCSGTAVVNCHA